MTCLCWCCESLVELLFLRLVRKRRRQKQYSSVCGLPLSLTLPDGSTVAVKPMTESQLSQTLAIRRLAESFGSQPGLGITRCLSDDDFRSEVKGVHKFAITMVSDVAAAAKARGSEAGAKRNENGENKRVQETEGTRKRKADEDGADKAKKSAQRSADNSVCDRCGFNHSLKPRRHHKLQNAYGVTPAELCPEADSVNEDVNVCFLDDHNIESDTIKPSDVLNKESAVGVSIYGEHQETLQYKAEGDVGPGLGHSISGCSDAPQGNCMQDALSFSQGTDDSMGVKTAPVDSGSQTAGSLCHSKKPKRNESCRIDRGEQLVAAVILTDSKYYRGPSFVTPWSFVSPAYRGRGLDSLCLSISELMAKRLGFWGLYLDMLVTDWASVALVERKAGYMRVGTLPHVEMDKEGQPVGCHVYYKDLRTFDGLIEHKEMKSRQLSLREKSTFEDPFFSEKNLMKSHKIKEVDKTFVDSSMND